MVTDSAMVTMESL